MSDFFMPIFCVSCVVATAGIYEQFVLRWPRPSWFVIALVCVLWGLMIGQAVSLRRKK